MPDPNITDTCLFMSPGSPWYLSPDCTVVGPVSGPDNADAGKANPITVHVHRNNNTLPAGATSVQVEVWVGNPSLAMAPNVNTKLIGTVAMAIPAAGGTATGGTNFTPSGGSSTAPDAAGHRCLVARCWAGDIESPDPASFYIGDDSHYVQHNITVVEAPAGGAPIHIGLSTGNPRRFFQGGIRIQAIENLHPTPAEVARLLPTLHRVKSFRALATTRSAGFTMDLSHLHEATTAVHQEAGVSVHDVLLPSVNAAEVLKPGVTAATVLKPGVPLASVLREGVEPHTVVAPATPAALIAGTALEHAGLETNFNPTAAGMFGALHNPNILGQISLPPRVFNNFILTIDPSKSKAGNAHLYECTQAGPDGKFHGGCLVVMVAR